MSKIYYNHPVAGLRAVEKWGRLGLDIRLHFVEARRAGEASAFIGFRRDKLAEAVHKSHIPDCSNWQPPRRLCQRLRSACVSLRRDESAGKRFAHQHRQITIIPTGLYSRPSQNDSTPLGLISFFNSPPSVAAIASRQRWAE